MRQRGITIKITFVDPYKTETTLVRSTTVDNITKTRTVSTTRTATQHTPTAVDSTTNAVTATGATANSTQLPAASREWPKWEEGLVAGIAGAVFVALIIGAVILYIKRKHRRQRNNVAVKREDSDTDPPVDMARFQTLPAPRVHSPILEDNLRPRSPEPLYGENPYSQPNRSASGQPYGPDDISGRAQMNRSVSPLYDEAGGINYEVVDDADDWRPPQQQHINSTQRYA